MRKFIYYFIFCFIFCLSACTLAPAQNPNSIKAKCPSGIAGYSSLTAQLNGNINAIPCAGRNFQVNGVTVVGGGVTGGGTVNFVPLWTSATAQGNSLISQVTGEIRFGLPTDAFYLGFDTGNGLFQITDLSGTNVLNFDTGAGIFNVKTGAGITLNSGATTTSIGDTSTVGNDTVFSVIDGASTFNFSSAGAVPIFAMSSIMQYQFNRTVTAIGTTGDVTINKPVGTVNIAGAASSAVVTNSVVSATSIIFTTTRTNDATCTVKNVVAASGSFTVNMDAACTGTTSVGFLVTQ